MLPALPASLRLLPHFLSPCAPAPLTCLPHFLGWEGVQGPSAVSGDPGPYIAFSMLLPPSQPHTGLPGELGTWAAHLLQPEDPLPPPILSRFVPRAKATWWRPSCRGAPLCKHHQSEAGQW